MTIDMDESAPSCGFCGDKRDLKDPGPTEFAFRPYQFEDAWEAVQLCQDCVGVLITYLDRVPEADHNGPDPNRNVFYPESLSKNPVNISKEQADHVEILNKFNELSPGERVYFEAIRYGYENYITQYISGEAIVGKYDEGEFIGKSHWTPASKLEGVLFTPQPYDIYLEPKTGWERKNDWLRIQLNTPDRSGLKHNHGPDTVTVLRTI
jgi:hypothetical protein